MIGALVFFAAIGAVGYAVLRKRPSIEDDPMGRIRDTKAVAIADAPEVGPVKVVGAAAPIGRAFTAPFSGLECVYYRVSIEEKILCPTGETDEHGRPIEGWEWTVRAAETKTMNFTIKDGTGGVRVVGESVTYEVDAERGKGYLDAPSPEQLEWLATHGFDAKRDVKQRALRYREFCIEVGERVGVRGMPDWEADPSAAAGPYREMAAKRMVFEGRRVVVSDNEDALD